MINKKYHKYSDQSNSSHLGMGLEQFPALLRAIISPPIQADNLQPIDSAEGCRHEITPQTGFHAPLK
jgi:hypothetical protein